MTSDQFDEETEKDNKDEENNEILLTQKISYQSSLMTCQKNHLQY